MDNKTIGWNFPPNGGGEEDGYNNPGIAHFKGAPLPSLAREILQNSLDAAESDKSQVHVSFELIDIPTKDIGGDDLRKIIERCLQKATVEEDEDVAISELKEASKLISDKTITCLRISDRQTTGLRGKYWKALVKESGTSRKGQDGAGGSHGIGKNAPFILSTLRTIFYWTCWYEKDKPIEKMQGKSILMSHRMGEKMRQGTGFYGIVEECKEIVGSKIYDKFRIVDGYDKPIQGTSISIIGFKEEDKWRDHIGENIIANFFYAIDHSMLSVTIEPENNSDEFEINAETLSNYFEKISTKSDSEDLSDDVEDSLYVSKALRELYLSDEEPFVKDDPDFGKCKLWIRTGDGLPKKVGFIRKSGMLITTQQKGLMQFPGKKDFIALCVMEDQRGNDLLRGMENVQHDQFEYKRLPEEEQDRGRKALERIKKWIRKKINDIAGSTSGGNVSVLAELSNKLPDLISDDEFENSKLDKDGNIEEGFATKIAIELKPIRKKANSYVRNNQDDEIMADGEDQGSEGGSGIGNGGKGGSIEGPGEGEGKGGTGTRGGEKGRKVIQLSKIRRKKLGHGNYRLSFVPEASGTANIQIKEAGDSVFAIQDYIRAAEGSSLSRYVLEKGKRCYLDIISDEPLEDRALHLAAVTEEK